MRSLQESASSPAAAAHRAPRLRGPSSSPALAHPRPPRLTHLQPVNAANQSADKSPWLSSSPLLFALCLLLFSEPVPTPTRRARCCLRSWCGSAIPSLLMVTLPQHVEIKPWHQDVLEVAELATSHLTPRNPPDTDPHGVPSLDSGQTQLSQGHCYHLLLFLTANKVVTQSRWPRQHQFTHHGIDGTRDQRLLIHLGTCSHGSTLHIRGATPRDCRCPSEEDEPWQSPRDIAEVFFHSAVLRRANISHLIMAWETPPAAWISSCC